MFDDYLWKSYVYRTTFSNVKYQDQIKTNKPLDWFESVFPNEEAENTDGAAFYLYEACSLSAYTPI